MTKTVKVKFNVGDNVFKWNKDNDCLEEAKIVRIELKESGVDYYLEGGYRYGTDKVEVFHESLEKCLNAAVKCLEEYTDTEISSLKRICARGVEECSKKFMEENQKLEKSFNKLSKKKQKKGNGK